ncbi:MAG: hypothetical protein ACLP3Q_01945 [Streptosporangiaceae bacterium]
MRAARMSPIPTVTAIGGTAKLLPPAVRWLSATMVSSASCAILVLPWRSSSRLTRVHFVSGLVEADVAAVAEAAVGGVDAAGRGDGR